MGRVLESGLLAQLIACVTNYRDAGRHASMNDARVPRVADTIVSGIPDTDERFRGTFSDEVWFDGFYGRLLVLRGR